MTEIRFYHLERHPLEQALPMLLSKALENGHKIVVKANNDQTVERLNTHLWTYNSNSFLPHGSKKDGHSDKQPIWLTSTDENPNNADVLILIDAVPSGMQDQFKLCCEIFNGRNTEILEAARKNWKEYQTKDFSLTYWQQGQSGWKKKN